MNPPNWSEASATLEDWWNRRRGGPVAQITALRDHAEPLSFDWWWFSRPDADPAKILETFERWVDATWFGGAAFPNIFFNLGPGVLAACFNDFFAYQEESQTVWFENPQSWDVVEGYRFQPEGKWMRFLRESMDHFRTAGSGRFLMGITDLGGGLDILASFRGGENLAMDLLLAPERVNTLRGRVMDAWFRAYDDLQARLPREQPGTTAWMGLWSPGRWYPLQCDFSAMISPKMFAEFVAPDLAEQASRLDHAIYHLDGPGQIPHLDQILDIDAIDGIQWVPGAGHPQNESEAWYPLYERILARDKLLVLQCWEDLGKVPRLLKDFPSGRVLCTLGADRESGGKRMLEWFD